MKSWGMALIEVYKFKYAAKLGDSIKIATSPPIFYIMGYTPFLLLI
jgi:hypothetical protein